MASGPGGGAGIARLSAVGQEKATMDYIVSIHMAKELSRFEMEQFEASSVRVAAVDQEEVRRNYPACLRVGKAVRGSLLTNA